MSSRSNEMPKKAKRKVAVKPNQTEQIKQLEKELRWIELKYEIANNLHIKRAYKSYLQVERLVKANKFVKLFKELNATTIVDRMLKKYKFEEIIKAIKQVIKD